MFGVLPYSVPLYFANINVIFELEVECLFIWELTIILYNHRQVPSTVRIVTFMTGKYVPLQVTSSLYSTLKNIRYKL